MAHLCRRNRRINRITRPTLCVLSKSLAEIVVLQRTDPNVPWDADPEEVEGLTLLENGDLEGDLIPIGAQSDRIEWRIFARYTAGAFDPAFGASHGWKESPRFIQLGATYTAAPRIYRSVDR